MCQVRFLLPLYHVIELQAVPVFCVSAASVWYKQEYSAQEKKKGLEWGAIEDY